MYTRRSPRATGKEEIMPTSQGKVGIFLEVGKKKVFAGAPDWPGWCRWGRDEEGAIQALLQAAARYAHVVEAADVAFDTPQDVGALDVMERVEGNATTDFGATDAALTGDDEPVDDEEMRRLERLLKAMWAAFDAAVAQAEGKELRKGPRGGGRDLEGIVNHVVEADLAYLRKLGWKVARAKGEEDSEPMKRVREGVVEGLKAAAAGQLPEKGPRGGKRWSPRRFVRRHAWHVLDHVWEIEDRIVETT
jgi:hypothetical protein